VIKVFIAPYLIWIALVGGLLVGGVGVGWFQGWRLDKAREAYHEERSSRLQMEAVVQQLRKSNTDLKSMLQTQNDKVIEIAKLGEDGRKATQEALDRVRLSNRATAQTIASLTTSIRAGTGDCSKALQEIRASL
jgi:hypothetical protein